jgi:hypothetical protein
MHFLALQVSQRDWATGKAGGMGLVVMGQLKRALLGQRMLVAMRMQWAHSLP